MPLLIVYPIIQASKFSNALETLLVAAGIGAGIGLVDAIGHTSVLNSQNEHLRRKWAETVPRRLRVTYDDSDGNTQTKLIAFGMKDAMYAAFVPLDYRAITLPIKLDVLNEEFKEVNHTEVTQVPFDLATLPSSGVSSLQPADTSTSQAKEPGSPIGVSDIDLAPLTSSKNPHALAVLIGIETYGSNLPGVKYAGNDVRVVREYLVRTLGLSPNNIITLQDEQATLGRIRSAIEGQLKKRVKPGVSDVFVYYAGHGIPDASTKSAYIVPYDGDPTDAAFTSYSLTSLYSALAGLRANSSTVMLDSCFSGTAGRGSSRDTLLPNARPVYLEAKTEHVPPGVTVFAATNGTQMSSGYNKKHHGLFTYFFLKGLKGAADLDRDRSITVGEMQDYLSEQVPEVAKQLNQNQTPTLLGGRKDRILSTF